MPTAPDTTQAITETVNRYMRLVSEGSSADLAAMYAEDATLEDPVGSEPHVGRDAIRGFYSALDNVKTESELVSLRVAGNEAAFLFRLTVTAGDSRTLIEPMETMAFDADGQIVSMRAYWSPANVTQL